MENKQRKQGWYWVKIHRHIDWRVAWYNGELWHLWDDYQPDSFFHSINEQRITTPEEPSVLNKAIELMQKERKVTVFGSTYSVAINRLIAILEQLKSEV
jgi:hypothetical protein